MSAWGLRPVPDNVPGVLSALPRWVCWVAEAKGNDKYDKVPINPRTGRNASTSNPADWGTRAEALDYWLEHPRCSGIGLVLTGNTDGLFAIDLDRCSLGDPRLALLLGVTGLYIERSPSGNGYRAIGIGEAPEFTHHAAGVECYNGSTARFVTLTGHTVSAGSDDLRVPEGALDAFFAAYRPERPSDTSGDRNAGDLPELPAEPDPELLARARDALPARLWERWDDGTVPEQYPSRSEVDRAILEALLVGGLGEEEVWRAACWNEHLMERALDARKRKPGRAMKFLWQEVTAAEGSETVSARRPPRAEDFAEDGDHPDQHTEENIPTETNPVGPQNVARKAPRGKLVMLRDLQRYPVPQWLVREYIEHRTLVMLFGDPGTGKSFVALDISLSVARGVPWNGKETRQGLVVYVAGEGHQGITRRILAHAAHHGYDIADVPMAVSRMGVPFSNAEAVDELLEEIRMLELLYDAQCVLLVIDTLRRNFGQGDENSTKDMAAFIAGCSVLQRALDATIAVVHHTGHTDKGRERGSSTLIGDFDIRYLVGKLPSGSHVLRNAKMKDAEPPAELAFDLRQVGLGYLDDQGNDVTSAVPVWGEPRAPQDDDEGDELLNPPREKVDRRKKAQSRLHYGAASCLDLLDQCCAQVPETAPDDCVDQGATVVVKREVWFESVVARRICRTDDERSARDSFSRWTRELVAQGLVDHSDDRVFWWVSAAGHERLATMDRLVSK